MCQKIKILDVTRTHYELSLKKGLHIKLLKPKLNEEKKHEVISLLV